jgi:hypothetical protein
MTKYRHFVFLAFNLLMMSVCAAASQQTETEKLFAGTWRGTRTQWIVYPPIGPRDVRPERGSAPFELEVDAAERHFLGFEIASRNGRTISGKRIWNKGGCQWQEIATLTVAADGLTAKFSSKSVAFAGPWPCIPGTTVENTADLRKVR